MRPTKLTPDLLKEFEKLVYSCEFLTTICDYVGIDRKTYYNWMNRGEQEEGTIFSDFFYTIKKALAAVRIKILQEIREGAQGWQSKCWIMERRWFDDWGIKDKQAEKLEINPEIKIYKKSSQ